MIGIGLKRHGTQRRGTILALAAVLSRLAGTAAAWLAIPSIALAGAAALSPTANGHAPSETGTGRPRIVTLAPNATEMVYAAGAGGDIVGTVLRSDYPPAARDIPRVGDGIQFSDEAILALHPTLVVAWRPTGHIEALAARLRPLGIPVVYTDPRRLEDIPALIRRLGARLETAATANAAAATLGTRIAALQAPPGPPLTVFIEVGADPLYTLGRDPLINDMLTRCGGANLYAGNAIAAPQISVESVLYLDPQVFIVSSPTPADFAARRRWWAQRGLAAARDGHFHNVPADWLHRPGPRLIDAAAQICGDLSRDRDNPAG